jgi:hypothetical protein
MLVARGTILTAANKPDSAITQIENARTIYQSLHDAGSVSQANMAACDVKMGEAAAKARRDQNAVEPSTSAQDRGVFDCGSAS